MRKNALITGGTKGIGKSIATSLAGKGYDLILTYSTDQNAAQEAVTKLQQEYDIVVRLLKADATAVASISQINEYIEENNIKLDAVIFNAGITCRDAFEKTASCEVSPERFR